MSAVESSLGILLTAVVVAPATVGAALLTARSRAAEAAAGWLGVTTLALAAAASVVVVLDGASVSTGFVAGADLGLTTAGPASVILPVVLAVAALVLLAATATPETRERRFTGLMLLFTSAAALTVLATSLPTLLLGWEVMGAASYALIGYRYGEARRVASGALAFLTTRAADLGLYLATAAALAGGSDLSLSSLADLDGGWRDVAAAGILLAALGKAAQLPFSFWLARAMDGPSPVSALLHSAAMVALGGYLLLRVSPLLAATGWAAGTAAWVGAATAVVLGAVAVVQRDLKQLLAASTAAQLGFVVLAAGVGASAAGTAHLVAHAAVKALLFLAAGAWLEALGSKHLTTLRGAGLRWPALGVLASAALLSLAGIPPFALWGTKDSILAVALERSPFLYAAGLLATALAAAYAVRALVVLLGLRHRDSSAEVTGLDEEQTGTREVPRRVLVALVPLAMGAVSLAALAWPPALQALPGAAPVGPAAWELVVSGLVALAVAVLVVLWRPTERPVGPRAVVVSGHGGRLRGRLRGWLGGWLGLETLAVAGLARPVVRAAEAAARLDDRVLARGVDLVASGTLALGAVSARGDAGLAAVVSGVASTARRAGGRVRRTSATGQLHHYYLQLVAGVLLIGAVLAVVLLLTTPR